MSTMPYPTPQQVFQMQFESVRRDEVVGVLLAFFLGCFGLHHFYLNRVGLGILYCCFCWTGIPAILGVIECFFMPGRVRIYNAVQAAGLAAALGITLPGYAVYPGWAAPGYGYPQSIHVSVQTDPDGASSETTLVACGQCRQTNPPGARFCARCGNTLG
jgi:TM2 domain-containing membrane protein YozV